MVSLKNVLSIGKGNIVHVWSADIGESSYLLQNNLNVFLEETDRWMKTENNSASPQPNLVQQLLAVVARDVFLFVYMPAENTKYDCKKNLKTFQLSKFLQIAMLTDKL